MYSKSGGDGYPLDGFDSQFSPQTSKVSEKINS
jgi:hypothetical protein